MPAEQIREIVVIVVIRVRSCRQVLPSRSRPDQGAWAGDGPTMTKGPGRARVPGLRYCSLNER